MKKNLQIRSLVSKTYRAAFAAVFIGAVFSACHPHDKKPLADIDWMRSQGRTEAQRITPQGPAQVVRTGLIADLLEVQVGADQAFVDVRNLQTLEIKGDYQDSDLGIVASQQISLQFKIQTQNQDSTALELKVLPIQFANSTNAGTAEHIHQAVMLRQVSEGVYIFSLTLNLQYLRDKIVARPIAQPSGQSSSLAGLVRNFSLSFFVSQESGKTSQIFSRNITLIDRAEYRTPPAQVTQPGPPPVE